MNCMTNIKHIGESECKPNIMHSDLFLHSLTIDQKGNIYDYLGKNIIGWWINVPNNRIRGKLYDSEIRFNCNIKRKPLRRDTKTLKYSVINANYE